MTIENKSNFWSIPNFQCYEFEKKQTNYCIVIPILNEGDRIKNQLILMQKISKKIDVIIADGNSEDGSTNFNFLKSNNVRTLLIKKDQGKLSAQLRMAYSYALKEKYEGIITIDGNGKDDVTAIPNFIEELKKGYDYIQGSRFINGGKAINTPLIRLLAIKFIHAPMISIIAKKKFTDTTNGFRAYSAKYLLDTKVQPFRKVFDSYELLAYLSVKASLLNLNTKEIPVTRSYPYNQKIPTKINGIKGYFKLLKILYHLLLDKYSP